MVLEERISVQNETAVKDIVQYQKKSGIPARAKVMEMYKPGDIIGENVNPFIFLKVEDDSSGTPEDFTQELAMVRTPISNLIWSPSSP